MLFSIVPVSQSVNSVVLLLGIVAVDLVNIFLAIFQFVVLVLLFQSGVVKLVPITLFLFFSSSVVPISSSVSVGSQVISVLSVLLFLSKKDGL